MRSLWPPITSTVPVVMEKIEKAFRPVDKMVCSDILIEVRIVRQCSFAVTVLMNGILD